MEEVQPLKRRKGPGPRKAIYVNEGKSHSEDELQNNARWGGTHATEVQAIYPGYKGFGQLLTLPLRPKDDNALFFTSQKQPKTLDSTLYFESHVVHRIFETNEVLIPSPIPEILTAQDIVKLLPPRGARSIMLWRKLDGMLKPLFKQFRRDLLSHIQGERKQILARSRLPPSRIPTEASLSTLLHFEGKSIRQILAANALPIPDLFPPYPTVRDVALLVVYPRNVPSWRCPVTLRQDVFDVFKTDLIEWLVQMYPSVMTAARGCLLFRKSRQEAAERYRAKLTSIQTQIASGIDPEVAQKMDEVMEGMQDMDVDRSGNGKSSEGFGLESQVETKKRKREHDQSTQNLRERRIQLRNGREVTMRACSH